MSPRAKPPAPPRFGLPTKRNGAPAGTCGSRLRALSTTRTLRCPFISGMEDSRFTRRSIVFSTYSWRLNVVMATPSRTSRCGAVRVRHSPPRTTTPSSRAVTATYRDSAARERRFGHSTVSPASTDAMTVSTPSEYDTSSTRARPERSTTARTSCTSVRRPQRPAANTPNVVSKVARAPLARTRPSGVAVPSL